MNATFQRRARLSVGLLAAFAAVACVGDASAAAVFRQGSGANAAALQATVDQFRADLGGALNPNNGTSFPDGRREVNWDGVPDQFAEPNNLPPNFFNVNSPRGIVFHTLAEPAGTTFNQFAVSSNAASGVPVRFGNINALYTTQFQTFSAQKLFVARGTNTLMVNFFKPGTTTPATTSGFGLVLADVDGATSPTRTIIYAYAPDGSQMFAGSAPAFDGGLSFVGVSFNAGERIGHVVIRSGTTPIGPTADDNAGAGIDVVAMDDFIYGEPQPVTGCVFSDGFECPVP